MIEDRNAPPQANTALQVQGQALQHLYSEYMSGAYVVNRRYQRKLVWAVEEKQALIDSVRLSLPIPLVLLAEHTEGDTGRRFEIIDGLQRLNALFGFIENEFSYKGEFFDLETLADTKYLRDQGVLKQRQPMIDRSVCVAITNYLLPLSTYRSASQDSIDEVFRRINSSGKKLSYQEIRQAGVTSSLAKLVRKLSASIRTDVSLSDVLPLSEMHKISITNTSLAYGIASEDIFWVKNGILDKEAVRESRDEELVLDLLLDIIVKPLPVSGSEYRNSAYGRDVNSTTSEATVSSRINSLGADNIEHNFIATLDVIRRTIAESGQPWSTWVKTQQNPRGIPRYFHAVFISIYEIIADEGLELGDLAGLTSSLKGFWDKHLTMTRGGGNWGANKKRPLFEGVKAILRPHFSPSDDPLVARQQQTATAFELELKMALTETKLFELKQGFTRLSSPPEIDDDAFEKVLRTASAMANESKTAAGYIFFGVADKPADADRIAELYEITPRSVEDFQITGTQHELSALRTDRDSHMQWLVTRIRSSKLESDFASQLANSLILFEYEGYLIWSLRPKSLGQPTSWDGKFHLRQGNSTYELQGPELRDLMTRFI